MLLVFTLSFFPLLPLFLPRNCKTWQQVQAAIHFPARSALPSSFTSSANHLQIVPGKETSNQTRLQASQSLSVSFPVCRRERTVFFNLGWAVRIASERVKYA